MEEPSLKVPLAEMDEIAQTLATCQEEEKQSIIVPVQVQETSVTCLADEQMVLKEMPALQVEDIEPTRIEEADELLFKDSDDGFDVEEFLLCDSGN